MGNKAERDYWDSQYRGYRLHIARSKDIIRRCIEAQLAPLGGQARSCLEIGCHPGCYLAVFGELGYELNGVDFAEGVAALPGWLRSRGYRVGSIWQEDFSRFNPQRSFDLVTSFGFIEHFTDGRDVLAIHAAPNVTRAFQHWLHANFDQANYALHHIPAMDVQQWAALLQARGLQILFCGPFGRFRFWTEPQARSLRQRNVLRPGCPPRLTRRVPAAPGHSR